MAETILKAETGRQLGSRESRRLRREGNIPGVLYGQGIESCPLHVDAKELRNALQGEAGINALLSLQVGSKSYTAMAKVIQRHPVKGNVIHVDFQVTDPDKPVVVDVPITLIGHSSQLQMAGGIVDQQLFSVTVKARPESIPHAVELDISSLQPGGSLRVSDVEVPSGVEIESDPDTTIVTGALPRGIRDEEVGEEQAAEGAAEEGTSGGRSGEEDSSS
ncbi:MAG: 50S ribosomal protein L25 [Actinobacteria bacterium]|nr:50S ribosomal protein L25 [Actinomycetota bacterium]MCL5886482.1 50S ribosomal protein L25 [Actinomycetota bacterium]